MSGIAATELKRDHGLLRGEARRTVWVAAGVFGFLFALLFQYRILSLLKKLGMAVTPFGARFPLVLDFQHAPQWALPFLYTLDYLNAVWSATLIGLFLGGALQTFLPGLVRGRLSGKGIRQQVFAMLLGLPHMLCSCCAVGAASGLRRAGAGSAAALTFFVAAPTLNLVSLILAFQMLPLKLALARALLGLVAVLGAGYLTVRLAPGEQETPSSAAEASPASSVPEMLWSWLRHTGQLARTVLPVLLAGFLLIGLVRTLLPVETWAPRLGNGVVPTVLAALVGTVLMIPTFTEVIWVSEFTRHGMGVGPAVALLITLPSVSLPSLWALGRSLKSYRAAVCLGMLVLALGIAGGLLLSLI